MITKNKNCEECQKPFFYDFNDQGNYPDKRKYCDGCSTSKKAQWDAKQNAQPTDRERVNAVQQAIPTEQPVAPVNETNHAPISAESGTKATVINYKDKPHSYEFGKAVSRHKIYYNNVNELQAHMILLRDAKLLEEDIRDMPDNKFAN